MALVAIAFSFIVTAMVAYQSVRQIENDREYRTLHAVYTVRASIKGTIRITTASEPPSPEQASSMAFNTSPRSQATATREAPGRGGGGQRVASLPSVVQLEGAQDRTSLATLIEIQ